MVLGGFGPPLPNIGFIMAVNISLTDIASLQNESTAIAAINANSAAITTAFQDALALDGTTPNSMQADLDMNSNRIINLPTPISNTEPMRIIDFNTLQDGGDISVSSLPTGGTANQVLTKQSSTNFDVAWENTPGVNPGTANTLAYYSTTTDVDSNTATEITNGALSLGTTGHTGSLTLNGTSSGGITITVPSAAGSGTITLPSGNTNFSSSGGTSQVVKQTSSGGALTVGQLAASDLSNGTTGSGAVVLADSPTLTGSNFISLSQLDQEPNGYSFLGNLSSGAANYQSFQIGSLSNKVSPTPNDLLLVADETSGGAIKYSTIGQAIAAVSSGVTTINSQTGVVSLVPTGGATVTNTGGNIYLGTTGSNNKFRNGGMDVWQRGTSITATTAGKYTADGWIVLPTGASVVASQSSGRGPTLYSLLVTGASSVTDVIIKQRIESFVSAPMTSQVVTVQAQVYNNTGGSITPKLTVKHAGSADNWTSSVTDVSAVNLQACANTAWTQVAYVFTDAGSAANGLEISFDFGNNFSSGSQTLKITELDIRVTPGVSSGATTSYPSPAELRPIFSELLNCQRYLYNWTPSGASSNAAQVGVGQCISSTQAYIVVSIPLNMRAIPTFTASTASYFYVIGASGTPISCTAVSESSGGVTEGLFSNIIYCTVSSGLAAGNATWMQSNNASASLTWSAEL